MYHSVVPDAPNPGLWTVRLDRFDRQMRWLHAHGRRGVSVRELLEAVSTGSAAGLVGLTFDDGYADFAVHVLPVLQNYGFTATAFVVAGMLGGDSKWAKEYHRALMTAEQVRQVAEAGMEIGSHGLNHLALPEVVDSALVGEIEESRRILEKSSGREVLGFCYPYGRHDEHVVDSVRAAGYDYSCAVGYSRSSDRHTLSRIYIGDADNSARLWAKCVRHSVRRGGSHP
jgi:peptidoglycan/xylan/chitin deacetylase (PgdA/CDA1 family)